MRDQWDETDDNRDILDLCEEIWTSWNEENDLEEYNDLDNH